MAGDFLIIAVTPPKPFADEAEWVKCLLDSGQADRIHLRHPGIKNCDLEQLLNKIGCDYFSRLSLHDCPGLVSGELGFHFNSRHPYSILPGSGKRSMSVHSNTVTLPPLDYITLSPVFDSISKVGYKANSSLNPRHYTLPAIALGGVTPDRFPELKQRGFAGAAMLGYFKSKHSELCYNS